MIGGMGELVSGLLDLLRSAGKVGGYVSLAIGLVLIPAGYYLFAHGAGPGRVWPIMLGISVVGLASLLMGLGVLFGNQARLDAAYEGGDIVRADFAEARAAAESASVPFGACGDCAHVQEGALAFDRCPNCFSVPGWLLVEQESERGRALSSLS